MDQVGTRASAELKAWVETRGGLRAAARELGIPHATLGRWTSGRQTPRGDGDLGPAWIEARTGVAATGWGMLAKTPVPPPAPAPPRRGPPPEAPALAPPRPRQAEGHRPAPGSKGSTRKAPPPRTRPAEQVMGPPPPPSATTTVAEMQARLRQIPAALAALHQGVVTGETQVFSAETLRRILEGEVKALGAAITASGTATVEEVEQLRALVLDVTKGCEGCRSNIVAALRERGG